jgi:hypothetical protein
MVKKYQIFISSTYEDLKEERKKVQDIILSMYQFPIGMEMFSAADEEQWEIIRETIDSSDYYVLVIGHRYGSVIEEGEYAGISYTQKEFRYALEQKIPVLAFLIDNSVAITPEKMEQDVDKMNKLKQFIQEVKSGRTVQWWTSKDDLANKVSIALTKEINRGKRLGWIRADKLNLEETQNEFVEMNKKIRELEEENKELKRNAVTRKPKLNVCINNEKVIHIPYFELNSNMIDCEYMLLEMDDVPNEAKTYITQEMIDEYNASLPSKEVLEKYKEECRYYEQIKEHPFDIELEIDNDGNMKARDIRIEVNFPEEIEVYHKKGINIPVPQRPSKKQNPIDKFYSTKSNRNGNYATITSRMSPRVSDLLMDSLVEMDAPNRHFYNDDNSLSIRMEDLMTGYQWDIKDKYIIAPKKKGVFEIVCSCICEEYEQSDIQIIKVVVK